MPYSRPFSMFRGTTLATQGRRNVRQQPSPPKPPQPTQNAAPSLQFSVFPADFTRAARNLATAQATPARGDLFANIVPMGASIASPAAQYAAGAQAGRQGAQQAWAGPAVGLEHAMANAWQQLLGGQSLDKYQRQLARTDVSNLASKLGTEALLDSGLLGFLSQLARWWI